MSMKLQDYIDRENLEIDRKMLQKFNKARALGSDIDDLVCDRIDELAQVGAIQHRESVDIAYYIANEIKKNFII